MSDKEELVYLRSKLSNVQAELQTVLNANKELNARLEGLHEFQETELMKKCKTLEAKVKELRSRAVFWEDKDIENREYWIKAEGKIQPLEAQLEVLTKCTQWEEGDCINWFPDKNDYCQGCNNKKLLEGVKSE